MESSQETSEERLNASLRLIGSGVRFGLVAQAAVFVLEFALAVLLARLLGPSGLGVLATVFAFSSLIVLMAGLQLETQAARSGNGKWTAHAFIWSLLAGGVGALLGLATAGILDLFNRPQQAFVLLAYLPFLILEPAVGLLRGSLRAAGRSAAATGYRVLAPFLRIMAVVPFALDLFEASPATIAFFFGMAEIMLFLGGVRLAGPIGWMRRYPRWNDLRPLIKGYSSLIVIAVTWLIILRTDLIMVAQLVSDRAAGGYHITLRLSEVAQQIYSAVLVMFLPALSALKKPDDLRTAWRSTSYISAAILIPILVSLGVWGDVIVGPIFGQGFVIARTVYVLMAVGLFIHALTGPGGYVLLALGDNRQLVLISVSTAILNVALNFYFIPTWGLIGAALATSLALLTMNAMYVLMVRKHFSFGRLGYSYVPWAIGLTVILLVFHGGLRSWNESLPVALGAGLTGIGLSIAATRVSRPARRAVDAVLRGTRSSPKESS